jgi:hypothetical protein
MLIAGSTRRFDTAAESAFGVRRSRKARQELAILKITRDVIGIFGQQLFEIAYSRSRIALIGAFYGQSVARKGVLRMGSNEFLE